MVKPELVEKGLLLMAVLIGCLALARTFGMLVHGPSAYNAGALVYESTTAVLSLVAWKLLSSAPDVVGEPA
jgi:hypothetical protein